MIENYFSWKIEGLGPYGFLHILFIILTIVSSYFICKHTNNHDEKKTTKVVFIIGLVFLFLETYKQLFYNTITSRYNFSNFPFQLCSTPMYLCLLSPLFKGELKKAIYSFLAYFGFIAGVTVMIFPETVIIDEVTISIQSLFWHGLMCVLGSYLIKTQNYGVSIKEIKPGIYMFIGFVIVAVIMNYSFEVIKNTYHISDYFNMFYISPYYECEVPILNDIWRATNFHIMLLCYITGVCLGACIIFGFAHLILRYKQTIISHKEA